MNHRSLIATASTLALTCMLLATHWVSTIHAAEGKSVRFTVKMLHKDLNEGCDIVDVNKDGKPDVVAGRFWYAAPDFKQHPLREIEDWNGYVQSNGEHAYDVDGDGWMDVIAGSFLPTEVYWFQNPGKNKLGNGKRWPRHLLKDTKETRNEGTFMRDLDGDGTPEYVVNSWNKKADTIVWKLAKDDAGKPTLTRHVIGTKANGHGMGFGDLNGDGHEDILVGTGWYERPAKGAFSKPWKYHKDWDWHASCPMLVVDLDGDGRNDIIRGQGHDYGLFWEQQLSPKDGKLQWKSHLIDKSYSQPHCLAWADIDGDGHADLITGKRVLAHNGKDPGGKEPACLYYYTWSAKSRKFTRHTIAEGSAGTGLQIRTGDLNGDGKIDLAVAGKSGTFVLINQGH